MNIGLIPDGNRRYADKNNISYEEAYSTGMDKIEDFLRWCMSKEEIIDDIVVYALSTENVDKRSNIGIVKKLYKKKLQEIIRNNMDIHKHEVRVKFAGEWLNGITDEMIELEELTEDYDKHTLYICMNYGAKKEIVNASKTVDFISEVNMSKKLDIPIDIDLVIRTGGYRRLSNFCVWQCAYADLYFEDKLWPEFTEKDLESIIQRKLEK